MMNNQPPYQFMPGWQGNPNFPGNFPPQQGGCNCKEQVSQIENRLNRMERQIKRFENRISRLENGFPIPYTANVASDPDYNSYGNNMYMM